MTNTDRILEEKLRQLFNDDDFVLGVFTFMKDQIARQELINYIDNNLENELTLDVLSDVAHMSKTYFSCQFRKLNGISPWEYITIKRIERAIEYIETTSMTRLEIALKCGFNNTSNFYHAFKRVTGKTPGDYKTHAAGS